MRITEQILKKFVGGRLEFHRDPGSYEKKIEDIYLEGKASGKTLVIVTEPTANYRGPGRIVPWPSKQRLVVDALQATPLGDGRLLLEDGGRSLKFTLYPKGWTNKTIRLGKASQPRRRS